MRERGRFLRISWPMACRRWVLPRPTPPQMKSGLYLGGSGLATARAAACASWFEGPATKVSNTYLTFNAVGGLNSPLGSVGISAVVGAETGGVDALAVTGSGDGPVASAIGTG